MIPAERSCLSVCLSRFYGLYLGYFGFLSLFLSLSLRSPFICGVNYICGRFSTQFYHKSNSLPLGYRAYYGSDFDET